MDIVNRGNNTIENADVNFYLESYEGISAGNFINISASRIHVPQNALVEPNEVGSAIILFVPLWPIGEHVTFLVESISIENLDAANFSLFRHPSIDVKFGNNSWKFDYSVVLTIEGENFFGTQSVGSLHQFTYNGVWQPPELRTLTLEYTKFFLLITYMLVFFCILCVWFPNLKRKLPFATLLFILLMVFIYAFVGSGREILAMPPYPWAIWKIWPLGTFMHTSDDHIFGNLTIFIPVSLLLEVWMNAKSSRRTFLLWYCAPIMVSMLLFCVVGFSIANLFLVWALWGLIIVKKPRTTRLNLLLIMFSGVFSYPFFDWILQYLQSVFNMPESFGSYLALMHITSGLIGAVIFGLLTCTEVRRQRK